jgi:bifunctional non-homologous end joining protein LigD
MSDKRVTLYCTEGGSDKVYTLWIEEKGGLYTVQALGGKRGGSQAPYTKGQPGSRAEAEKTYASVLKEKHGKGYHQGEDAPAYTEATGKTDGGLRPMLLTPDVEENLDRYINDDAWGAQEKFNGHHVMIRSTSKTVQAYNKKGLERPIPQVVEESLKGEACQVDGELVGETYYVFDDMGVSDPEKADCGTRALCLAGFVRSLESLNVRPVPLVIGRSAKRALVDALRNGKKEGVVFKLLRAKYTPGKVDNLKKSVAVKIKFYAEGSFLVLEWNKGVSSVEVAAKDGKKLVSIGNVTIPAKYANAIKKGDCLRVRYLYATDANQLYQPTLDADDAGNVVADSGPDALGSLKHEGKD